MTKHLVATFLLVVSGLSLPSPLHADTMAAGAAHSVVVTPDGNVWTFGLNNYGQLGDGTTTRRTVPVQVATISGVVAVAAGSHHVLALQNDGTVWAWGHNYSGELGNNSRTDSPFPILVAGLPPITAVAAGDAHSVALAADGSIWTWGANSSGQLGDGTTTRSLVPILVTTGWTSTAIGAGFSHTLAVRADGTLWGWGANGSGQLGAASPTQWTVPAQVSGVAEAVSAAGGYCHTVVLRSDGRVLTSGCNAYGQLGNNTTANRPSMDIVLSLENVTAVRAGYYFSSGRTTLGEIWSWGYNVYGQLGNGSTTRQPLPVRTLVSGVVTGFAAGHQHGLAATAAGVVSTWGSNSQGQLGDGTTINRSTPVQISDADYTWKVGTPTLSRASGTFYADTTVGVADATPGAEIHYTLNGADPTLADPTIATGGILAVDRTMTLKVRAWKDGLAPSNIVSATYTMVVATPVVSPGAGTYTAPVTVGASTTTANAVLRYTTGPSNPQPPNPNESSPIYESPLQFSTTTTLKVIGFRPGWSQSGVRTATYQMNFGAMAAPDISPVGGTYTNPVTVTLSAVAGATIRYTTNGSTPTIYSPAYTGPFTVSTPQTVKAIATHPDYQQSAVASSTYTVIVAAPVFSPGGGTYPPGQAVTISTDTIGATIRYTLDGRDPTTSDPVIAGGGSIFIGNVTLKARAWKGSATSEITAATYQLSGAIAPPQLDGGGDRSITAQPDGFVWGWGLRPGNGSGLWSIYPVRASSITGAKIVSAGGSHSLVVCVDGSVYAWGGNGSGQLGDGSTSDRNSPVLLTSIGDVTGIAGGAGFSVAVKNDGSVWTWGANAYGQLGDGTSTPRSTPGVVTGLTGVTAVAAGDEFVVALKANGTVWSWGRNQYGQLGDDSTTHRSTPAQIQALTNVIAIAAGGGHALALRSNGSIVGWGANASGQLGDGTTTQRLTPVGVANLGSITAIAAGGTHSMALASSGTIWTWGENGDGQLGDGTNADRAIAGPVNGLPPVAAIGAGASHSLAMTADGVIWTWGQGEWGELGDGTQGESNTPRQISGPNMVWKARTPTVNSAGGTFTVEQNVTVTNTDPDATLHYTTSGATPTAADPAIASGGTIVITQSLTLKVNAWKPGAPPSETVTRTFVLKVPVAGITPATGSYAGAITVTVTSSNAQATLTYTIDGSDPVGSSPVYSAPFVVAQTLTVKVVGYRAGWTPSDVAYRGYWITDGMVATPTIDPAGGPYAAPQLVSLACATGGATIRYTLDGSDPVENSPVYRFPFVVSTTTTVKARAFKAGVNASTVAAVTYALDAAGATATPTLTPAGGRFTVRQTVAVQGPAGATFRYTLDGRDPVDTDAAVGPERTIVVDRSAVLKVRAWDGALAPSGVRSAFFVVTGQVSAGGRHSLAVKADGTVWSWGYNASGELGDGTNTIRLSPVQALIGDVQAVAAAYDHSLALKRDGTVWAWGENFCGQLGFGDTTDRRTPQAIAGLANVVAIAAGSEQGSAHSLALKADGTVWAWGCNESGQLGDESTTTRRTPVQVRGLPGVTAIAAGARHSYALAGGGAAIGTLWAWGNNASQQLGDGSTTARPIPVRVLGVSDIVDIAATGHGAVARRADGTVWRWGGGATLDVLPPAPAQMPYLERILAIAVGTEHALAFAADRIRWGWGGNFWGELGNGDTATMVMTGVALASKRVLETPMQTLLATGGWRHSVLLRVDGSVATTGDAGWGQLGNGTTWPNIGVPAPIPGLTLVDNAWLASDADNDGLTAWREWLAGTDPYRFDTNGNGSPDGLEELSGPTGANPDTDLDGIANWVELQLGTDPLAADTDGDTVGDRLDAFPLDPTRAALPPPTPGDTTPPVITLTEPTSARPVGGGGGG